MFIRIKYGIGQSCTVLFHVLCRIFHQHLDHKIFPVLHLAFQLQVLCFQFQLTDCCHCLITQGILCIVAVHVVLGILFLQSVLCGQSDQRFQVPLCLLGGCCPVQLLYGIKYSKFLFHLRFLSRLHRCNFSKNVSFGCDFVSFCNKLLHFLVKMLYFSILGSIFGIVSNTSCLLMLSAFRHFGENVL